MFCNICRYGVRSKHFSYIFTASSFVSHKKQDTLEQLAFCWKVTVNIFVFSRCNKTVSMKRREERRLMILACWQCAWNQKVKNTHATHLARMTASTQNRTCLLWNCKLFSFVERKSIDQVICQTQVWLIQASKKLADSLKKFLIVT